MKRPWKARWWSFHWNDWCGASYSTEEKAILRVQHEVDEGCDKGMVYQTNGYNIVGEVQRIKPSK